jgi:hypothetical protein
MRARISTLARDRRQSMNSYIICALESVLKTDEEADGTYVAPVVEMVVPAQMVAIRPQFVPGMACRFEGKIGIIDNLYFGSNDVLGVEVITADGSRWSLEYDSLEPY